jgi:hypothetical protein
MVISFLIVCRDIDAYHLCLHFSTYHTCLRRLILFSVYEYVVLDVLAVRGHSPFDP